jgi:hypothetical protein
MVAQHFFRNFTYSKQKIKLLKSVLVFESRRMTAQITTAQITTAQITTAQHVRQLSHEHVQ